MEVEDSTITIPICDCSFPCVMKRQIALKAKAHLTCYCNRNIGNVRAAQRSQNPLNDFRLCIYATSLPVTIAAAVLFDYSVSTSRRMCVSAGPDAAPL